ncbi:ABC transporter permease [Leifsonia sp. PS1209]|nr:ABC transporter permease [Leifsonia sp. PS1209]
MAILTPIAYGTLAFFMAGPRPDDGLRVVLGAGLLGAWSTTLYGAAEALFMQRFSGTLEFLIGAPRSLVAPVVGFSAATVTLGLYSLIASGAWCALFFHVNVRVDEPILLVVTLLASFVGLTAIGMLLAALYVVLRQAIEVTNVLEFPIWIACGVLAPATTLWSPVQWVGKLLPLGWSTQALDRVFASQDPIPDLCVALTLALLYSIVAVWLLRIVDLRARVKGTLRLR